MSHSIRRAPMSHSMQQPQYGAQQFGQQAPPPAPMRNGHDASQWELKL
jgi:hypothetical protein